MAKQEICTTEPYRPYGAEIKETRPYPPCRAACPAHTDVQAYVGLIAQGRYTEAFEVITAPNPIASVCGVCHHPCERPAGAEIDGPGVGTSNLCHRAGKDTGTAEARSRTGARAWVSSGPVPQV
jgi:NADPH-dependent glutamate synthase beta subunit-like oxidoreductase